MPGGGGGGVNPFLSDSDEDKDEVSVTDERRAGLRLGAREAWIQALQTRCRPRTTWPWGAVPELGSPGRRRRP